MPARLSFQLYSARNAPSLDGTLAMLASAGFSAVEGFGGVYGDATATRALLDRHGLSMPSGHFDPALLERKPKQVIAIARTLGMNMLVAPWLNEDQRPSSAAGWRQLGRTLNGLAALYRSEGFGFAWHNHDFEFRPLKSGGLPHDILFEAAPLLDWEIDVAWVQRAGVNPLPVIKAYGAIITMAHVKDIAPRGLNLDEDGWCDIGTGIVKWPAVFCALGQSRCMHFILEHDNPADVGRFIRRSAAACRKM